MQKNTVTMSDRLKGILSDLSSFVGKDSSSAALPACESRDRDLFVKRLHSFRSSSWFAKPRWLSPVTCARYGWINVDVDLLRCVGCQSVLVVRIPSSFDPAIYEACQKRLEDQLKQTAHHPCCTWPSCPTPEVVILAHSGSSSQALVMEDFINKAVLLYSVGKYLPAVEHSSLSLSESDVSALCSLVTNSPRFLHDAEIPGTLRSAVLLALSGWNLSDGSKAFPGCTSVQCSLCMRQPGLWNYISVTDDNDREPRLEARSHSESLLDYEISAEKEYEDLRTAASNSPCAMVDSQLSPYEVVNMQSPMGSNNFSAVIEGSLPLSTTVMDMQESAISSQDFKATDESQGELPSITTNDGEPSPLAMNSDRDDSNEAVTDNVTAMADIYDRGDHLDASSHAHESLSGFLPSETKYSLSSAINEPEHCTAELAENLAGNDGLQMTDSHSPGDAGQQEPTEQNRNDDDRVHFFTEFDNPSSHKETKFSAAGSDAEEVTNDPEDVLTARGDESTHGCQSCTDTDDCNPDRFTSSDNMDKDVHNSSKPEDLSRASLEAPISAVDGSKTAEAVDVKEAIHEAEDMAHETEDIVQRAKQNEGSESDPQESLQQSALDLTVSGGLQRDESPTSLNSGALEQNVDTGSVEYVRHLLNDLISDVVQDNHSENDRTEKTLKQRGESPTSLTGEFVRSIDADIVEDVTHLLTDLVTSVVQDTGTEKDSTKKTLTLGLQEGGSPTSLSVEFVHSAVVEDVTHLLTDLISDVLQDTASESDTTGKPSKRCATDTPASSPQPKRRRPFGTVTQRTVFNPVAEHHLWCPYVSDIVTDGFNDAAHDAAFKPWLRLLRQLVPDAEAALVRVQTSPVPEGIDRIRKLFRSWTSTA